MWKALVWRLGESERRVAMGKDGEVEKSDRVTREQHGRRRYRKSEEDGGGGQCMVRSEKLA